MASHKVTTSRHIGLATKLPKALNEPLIKLVRDFSYLWDTGHKSYTDTVMKERRWSLIATTLNCTAEAAKTRWKGMRDQYRKDVKTMQSGLERKPRKHYKLLDSFLRSSCEPGETADNVPCLDEEEDDDNHDRIPVQVLHVEPESFEQNTRPSTPDASSFSSASAASNTGTSTPNFDFASLPPQMPARKRHKSDSSVEEDDDPITKSIWSSNIAFVDFIKTLQNVNDNDDDVTHYLLSLRNRMRRLTPLQQSLLRLKIEQVFNDVELNKCV